MRARTCPLNPTMPDTDVNEIDDDDVIVLPWWQHPLNILTIVITAALLAGMVGWMIGDSNSELAHNEVDTGFLQDMREHHEQAVYMSFVYRSLPDIDPGLRTVAGVDHHGPEPGHRPDGPDAADVRRARGQRG